MANHTIRKTVLLAEHEQVIEIPIEADIMYAREQNDEICIWYRCNPDNVKEKRKIIICGTGHPEVPGWMDAGYIGSAHLQNGRLVFHVFEKIDPDL